MLGADIEAPRDEFSDSNEDQACPFSDDEGPLPPSSQDAYGGFRYLSPEGLCQDLLFVIILVACVFVTGDIYGRHRTSLNCKTPIDVNDVTEERAIAMPLCAKNEVLSLSQQRSRHYSWKIRVTCNSVIASSSI